MPGAGRAEIIFVAAMMVLILVVCVVSVYAFFKTYKKEMREKQERLDAKKVAVELRNTGTSFVPETRPVGSVPVGTDEPR